MSRRLVSYSDISEPPPPGPLAVSFSQDGGAGGSSSSTASKNGKRKRHAEYPLKGKKWKGKRGMTGGEGNNGQGIVVHWDDPSYSADGVWVGGRGDVRNEEEEEEGEGGYRSHSVQLDEMGERRIGEGYGEDGEENEGESEVDGEMFYDAIDVPESSNATTRPSNTAKTTEARKIQHNQAGYRQWKYDENGEPYDRSHRHASHCYALGDGEEGQSYSDLELDHEYDHGQEHDEKHYDEDEEEEEEEEEDGEMLPFAIPDVVEFHRSWDARLTSRHTSSITDISTSSTSVPTLNPALDQNSSTPTPTAASTSTSTSTSTLTAIAAPQHRPPREVGGGGRTLHHTEIWGDLALVQAYCAALDQYVSMHSASCSFSSADTTTKDDKVKSALWHDAPQHDSLLAEQVKADTLQILALQRQSRSAHSPQSGLSGDNDKDAQKEDKGIIKSTSLAQPGQTKAKTKENMATRGKPILNIVPHGHLHGNSAWKKAVKVVQSTPNTIGIHKSKLLKSSADEDGSAVQFNDSCQKMQYENQKANNIGSKHQEQESKLYQWWYAGYHAGLTAASSTFNTEPNKNKDESIHPAL